MENDFLQCQRAALAWFAFDDNRRWVASSVFQRRAERLFKQADGGRWLTAEEVAGQLRLPYLVFKYLWCLHETACVARERAGGLH